MNLKRKKYVLVVAAIVRGYLLSKVQSRLQHVQDAQQAIVYAAIGKGTYHEDSEVYAKLSEFIKALQYLDDDGSLALVLDQEQIYQRLENVLLWDEQQLDEPVKEYRLLGLAELEDGQFTEKLLTLLKEAGFAVF